MKNPHVQSIFEFAVAGLSRALMRPTRPWDADATSPGLRRPELELVPDAIREAIDARRSDAKRRAGLVRRLPGWVA